MNISTPSSLVMPIACLLLNRLVISPFTGETITLSVGVIAIPLPIVSLENIGSLTFESDWTCPFTGEDIVIDVLLEIPLLFFLLEDETIVWFFLSNNTVNINAAVI